MRNDKENLTVNLALQFALDIIAFTEKPGKSRKILLASQILKSGTSIGTNVRETQSAESKVDVVQKLKITATKEVHETGYRKDVQAFSKSLFQAKTYRTAPVNYKRTFKKYCFTQTNSIFKLNSHVS